MPITTKSAQYFCPDKESAIHQKDKAYQKLAEATLGPGKDRGKELSTDFPYRATSCDGNFDIDYQPERWKYRGKQLAGKRVNLRNVTLWVEPTKFKKYFEKGNPKGNEDDLASCLLDDLLYLAIGKAFDEHILGNTIHGAKYKELAEAGVSLEFTAADVVDEPAKKK